jgi:CRISPR-associated protein Cmr1
MNSIEARFRIVTPMFLGDAEQRAGTIRPPSIKGVLRFWWRALNWGICRGTTGDDAEALRQLCRRETELFGGSAERGGQSRYLVSVRQEVLKTVNSKTVHAGFKSRDAARYLGYGLMEAFASTKKGTAAGQLTRECIQEGQAFSLRLCFRGDLDPTVHKALIALGLLGGLGSRSRHGFGSLALERISRGSEIIWKSPSSQKEYVSEVGRLLSEVSDTGSLPPFSAFSGRSRVDVILHGKSEALDVLDAFGRQLLMYRSWGRGGKVLGEASEMNFRADHDWSKGQRPKGFHPKRVIFGLPHNYGKQVNLQVKPERHERRASPLFFHVHQVGDQYIGVGVLLPATFLPQKERINAGGELVATNVEWSILTDFLGGKRKRDQKPRFPNKTTVLGADR